MWNNLRIVSQPPWTGSGSLLNKKFQPSAVRDFKWNISSPRPCGQFPLIQFPARPFPFMKPALFRNKTWQCSPTLYMSLKSIMFLKRRSKSGRGRTPLSSKSHPHRQIQDIPPPRSLSLSHQNMHQGLEHHFIFPDHQSQSIPNQRKDPMRVSADPSCISLQLAARTLEFPKSNLTCEGCWFGKALAMGNVGFLAQNDQAPSREREKDEVEREYGLWVK
jgi:hypothetical protein